MLKVRPHTKSGGGGGRGRRGAVTSGPIYEKYEKWGGGGGGGGRSPLQVYGGLSLPKFTPPIQLSGGGGGCYAMLQIVARQVQVPFHTNPNLMPYRLFHCGRIRRYS